MKNIAGMGFVVLGVLMSGCSGEVDPAPKVDTGTAPLTCTVAPTAFTSTVWPDMNTSCAICHVAGGLAGGTPLKFVSGGTAVQNYNQLRSYVQLSSAKADLLLSKSIGKPSHGGSNPFGDASSTKYKNLSGLVPTLQGACPKDTTPPVVLPTFWDGVVFTDDATALAKASMMFASRNPTAAEYSAVKAGGTSALRATVRSYMSGKAFEAFLDESGDTVFLPQGVVVFDGGGLGLNSLDFPSAASLIDISGGFDPDLRTRFMNSVRREGVELLKYVVKNDKPWTDMVAGNYTVMNGLVAKHMAASVDGTFVNPDDDTEWRRATWKNERLGGVREHAGVLSTHAWLQRFATTETNRNRHRVLMLGRQFLGFDINALAARPIEGSGSFLVPTLQDPNCKVCHAIMDPMAAGFQNWNERNRYLPYRTASGIDHALPFSYRAAAYPKDASGKAYYQPGDNWFRDSMPPGYNGTAMPGGYTGNKTALQWLGQQVAADARFPMGAVHFWYQAVFGRAPLVAPLDPDSPQYAERMAAYNAQNDEFNEIAARFATNQGHGAYNVKDLLVDLVLSKWFRAQAVTGLTDKRQIELADISASNMLTSAQLQRKLQALLGVSYADFSNPYFGRGLLYGNFDGNANVVRAKDHTILQTSTIDNLGSVLGCSATQADFGKATATRLLYPKVSLTDTPATAAGTLAIRQNIQHLHQWLLKENLPLTDVEIQRTYQLFVDIWSDRATAAPKPLKCGLNNTNDPNYTARAWSAVLAYLVGDPKFLFE